MYMSVNLLCLQVAQCHPFPLHPHHTPSGPAVNKLAPHMYQLVRMVQEATETLAQEWHFVSMENSVQLFTSVRS